MNKLTIFVAKNLFIILIAITTFETACSNSSTTKVSSTEVRRNENHPNYDDTSRVETSKSEEVTKEESHHGFFGILGDIIALPFRAIASIL